VREERPVFRETGVSGENQRFAAGCRMQDAGCGMRDAGLPASNANAWHLRLGGRGGRGCLGGKCRPPPIGVKGRRARRNIRETRSGGNTPEADFLLWRFWGEAPGRRRCPWEKRPFSPDIPSVGIVAGSGAFFLILRRAPTLGLSPGDKCMLLSDSRGAPGAKRYAPGGMWGNSRET
jgi:hypothetical protein